MLVSGVVYTGRRKYTGRVPPCAREPCAPPSYAIGEDTTSEPKFFFIFFSTIKRRTTLRMEVLLFRCGKMIERSRDRFEMEIPAVLWTLMARRYCYCAASLDLVDFLEIKFVYDTIASSLNVIQYYSMAAPLQARVIGHLIENNVSTLRNEIAAKRFYLQPTFNVGNLIHSDHKSNVIPQISVASLLLTQI